VISLGAILTSRALIVRGDSMLPSYGQGNVVLMSRRAFKGSGPARRDVVALRDPEGSGRLLLKRVIGLPGERIALSDGLLYVDGRQMDEPYLGGLPSSPGLDEANWQLREHEYLVLGDRRFRSTDSRQFGPVNAHQIIGKAWLKVWPLKKGPGV
jgi:signal peptidase I